MSYMDIEVRYAEEAHNVERKKEFTGMKEFNKFMSSLKKTGGHFWVEARFDYLA